ncbi:FAD dependent oxidoreductase-domain-containing protein [Zychaea mexicana]|uniref:FAD dependent oxidoreductase-domain-containing protein n=1 Tax=Zychaea mexicana TaxID=64656 RepID=UPI0022FED30A|nr:FAD dependent oxidoreductase-domain-containing protein [Zychaea mexicana]KAI9494706.1 FAD dependent oxidoreductase-domain-containing protein [Zychaea mexicana]
MAKSAATSSYTPPPPGSKIIIVGAGAFGLSTAYALSLKNKYDIWVFDRDTVPVPDAASTGLPIWEQWNKERAAKGLSPVYHKTGVIFFSKNGQFSEYEKQSMQNIKEAGYGHVIEQLSPESIVERFPHFKAAVENGYNVAYFNKEGGWCNSSEAIKHVYEKCRANGVRFVLGAEIGCFEQLYQESTSNNKKKVLGIKTKNKKIHRADRVIMATGSWTASLIDLGNKLVATGQIVMHFKPPPASIFHQIKNQPAWSADSSKTGFYGFPINADGKLKLACHSIGYLNPRKSDTVSVPRTQSTNVGDTIPVKALTEFRNFLSDFFPMTSAMDVHYTRVCWYSDSMDSNFLIAPHPDKENLIIVSGDSGHGMKFLPVIGLKVAQIVEGIETDYSRSWGWRDAVDNSASFDAMRAGKSTDIVPLLLCDPDIEETKMCTLEDYKAIVPKL